MLSPYQLHDLTYSHLLILSGLPAKTLCNIGTFSGECRILLTTSGITISDASGVELASWPYNTIRQFRDDEVMKFSFTSGRRGPFGIGEYDFFLTPLYLNELKSTLSKYIGHQVGIETTPEHPQGGTSPQQELTSAAPPRSEPRYIDDQLHYGGGVAASGTKSPTMMQSGFSQQRNSLPSLANLLEPNRAVIKKQLTLQELHGHSNRSNVHHPYEATDIGIPASSKEPITEQRNASLKKAAAYAEISPIHSDDKLGSSIYLHQSEQCDYNDGGSSNLDTSVRTRSVQKQSFTTSEPSNPVYSGVPHSNTHIYDKLPPRADTTMYDNPHSSVYSVPRLSESASPPPLNVRQGHRPSSPQSAHFLTRRPLPSTPVEEQYALHFRDPPQNVNSGYVDIDIQERANGDVYFTINKPSEQGVAVEERYVTLPPMQSTEALRFKPTPDVSSDSIARKLATDGYELVTVAQQGLQTFIQLDKKDHTLSKDTDILNATAGEEDDPDGYVKVRSHRAAPSAYENVNCNQIGMETNEDEQYATVHCSERKSSENGLYDTVQLPVDQFVPITVQSATHEIQKPREKILVPLATESSSPTANTAALRFRTRTVGDILDVEKHTYVNIKCDDDTLLRKGGMVIPTRKPKPAPRNSSLTHLAGADSFEETL